ESRPTKIKSAPASAKAWAIARPSPRLPPVIKARRPSRRNLSQTLMVSSVVGDRSAYSLLSMSCRQTAVKKRLSPCHHRLTTDLAAGKLGVPVRRTIGCVAKEHRDEEQLCALGCARGPGTAVHARRLRGAVAGQDRRG